MFRLSTKTFNRTGLNTEPWRTVLLTGCQLDVTPSMDITLGLAIQTVFYPVNGMLLHVMGSQFLQENTVRDSVKGFTKIKLDNFLCLSLTKWVTPDSLHSCQIWSLPATGISLVCQDYSLRLLFSTNLVFSTNFLQVYLHQ